MIYDQHLSVVQNNLKLTISFKCLNSLVTIDTYDR